MELLLAEVDDLDVELTNSCTSRMEQLEDFRELFIHLPDPRLGVAIDTLEFHRASVDPRGAVDELEDRITRLILRDAVGNRQVPLGEGEVNINSVLAHAARIGGIRHLCVEPLVLSWHTAVEELAAERQRLEAMLAGV
jgi:sugar phosphate isomerase/epimerase